MSGEVGTPSTSMQVKTSAFVEWVVKKDIFTNFSINTKGGIFAISKEFICGLEEKTSWILELQDCMQPDGIYVSLHLIPKRKPMGQIHTKYKVGLVTKDGEESNVKYANSLFTYATRKWGWTKFIKLDSLLSKENNYFKNDELTIFCDIERCVAVPKPNFSDDLSEMLKSKEFSDATLVVRGEELRVHRNVLASRSPEFRRVFHENKLRSCRLVIDDLDVNGLKGLLNFLYSGKTRDLPGTAEVVLPAAAKYGVETLKALCEQELCDKLNLQNVTDLLKLAGRNTANQLKEYAITYLCKNFTEVVKDPAFWKLDASNQELFSEVTCALAKATQAHTGEPLAKRIKLN